MNINIEQTTIKSITDGHKHMMQDLHFHFGFDFEGDYKIYHITGRFTAKSLNKYAENDYFTVLMHGTNKWNKDEFYMACSDGESFDTNNINYTDSWNRFWCKSNFDENRKNPYTDAYMITQAHRKYGDTYPKFNSCERFKKHGHNSFVPYGFNGKQCVDHYLYDDLFDKSGYPVELYRERLKEKAKKIREEREKAEYLKTDNSDKIATLERLINKYKKKLSEQILTVKTADDVRNLGHFICSWDGLSDIIDDFTNFKRNTEEKSFDSIKASNALYDHIAKCIYKYI